MNCVDVCPKGLNPQGHRQDQGTDGAPRHLMTGAATIVDERREQLRCAAAAGCWRTTCSSSGSSPPRKRLTAGRRSPDALMDLADNDLLDLLLRAPEAERNDIAQVLDLLRPRRDRPCPEHSSNPEETDMKLADNKATLSFSNGSPSVELPVYKGSIGPDVIDIRKLYARPACSPTTRLPVDRGPVAITYIDGDKGELLYRGYPIEQLATNCDFLETCYLLLYGELPNETRRRLHKL
jgi:hypothetical protein